MPARLRPEGPGAGTVAEAVARPGHRGLHNHVVLARLGPVTLVNFGLFAALGGAVAAWVGLARQAQAGMDPERYALLLLGGLPVLAVLGSRAFSVALDWREFLRAPLAELLKPGFAFQGGLAGATIGVVAVAFLGKVDLLMLLDAMALGFPLGHALGRLGCHTYGCCHGRPTRSPWSIRYTNPDAKAVRRSGLHGVPLHPTQLYSALGNVALFVLLTVVALGPVHPGEIAALFLLVGSTGRFFVEFLRGVPAARTLGLTPFQWVSAGLFACGVALLRVASTAPAHERFADVGALLASLRWAALTPYPLLVFVVIFVCFGIHGRKVGSFGS